MCVLKRQGHGGLRACLLQIELEMRENSEKKQFNLGLLGFWAPSCRSMSPFY